MNFFVRGGPRRQFWRFILSQPMKSKTTFKCLNCKEKQRSDVRNQGRQRYCAKADCRRASKAASQARWNARLENKDYFRGSANVERVRAWRVANPGYWRKGSAKGKEPLQETCTVQGVEDEKVTSPRLLDVLQETCLLQPALLVGLISVMTGHALQEDIAASARGFLTRGEDILRMGRGDPKQPSDEKQTYFVFPSAAARAAPV